MIQLLLLIIITCHYVESEQRDIHCYSCASVDPAIVIKQIQDPIWFNWFSGITVVPKTSYCQDDFKPLCEDGLCLKLLFMEKNGVSNIFRTCIPKAHTRVRPDCTKISSNEGYLEACICDGNLCNSSNSLMWLLPILVLLTLSQLVSFLHN
ncbi:unnamed protein product [Auanema sp. JU1783]|nr:unnamed protein product [Auanema sp. JU1783]